MRFLAPFHPILVSTLQSTPNHLEEIVPDPGGNTSRGYRQRAVNPCRIPGRSACRIHVSTVPILTRSSLWFTGADRVRGRWPSAASFSMDIEELRSDDVEVDVWGLMGWPGGIYFGAVLKTSSFSNGAHMNRTNQNHRTSSSHLFHHLQSHHPDTDRRDSTRRNSTLVSLSSCCLSHTSYPGSSPP
ncbi:hypothetical protein CC80DRAFT_329712 [Byssothecium circinans]|uniref:Uncharacterized protein n=1 Tax=Byssothecium circinans TaxID=147558 RepID=A0A6A5T5F1_9PLEO|nr:hypothetical protein CC80DRAFT_329712 [Byssothecium circinans]